jgi:ADP-heptose:LPS heptosyltransferase
VVMSLPTLAYLRKALPESELVFAAQAAPRQAVLPFLRQLQIVAADAGAESLGSALRDRAFDAALILHAPAQVYRELFLARVPLRYGDASRLWSIPFITAGKWQRRSLAEKSEAVYCLELAAALLRKLGIGSACDGEIPRLLIPADEEEAGEARRVVSMLDVGDRFLVVHPGMGGNALNLPEARYRDLLSYLQKAFHLPLVFSEGPAPADRVLVGALRRWFPHARVLPPIQLGILREVLRLAAAVIAPSTGPLHLAHYVGTPALALFSPIRNHRRDRWQPWGGAGPVTVLVPPVQCPAKEACLGERCREFYCMDTRWEGLLAGAGSFVVADRRATPAPTTS